MPFDYNSFLIGVQTGLKLQRPPEGRRPPAPSGIYLLTEDGVIIDTEDITPSSWYDVDDSYTADLYQSQFVDAEIIDQGGELVITNGPAGASVLYANITQGAAYSNVVYTVLAVPKEIYDPQTNWQYLVYYGTQLYGVLFLSNPPNAETEHYYYNLMYGDVSRIRPQDVEIFTGPLDEFERYLDGTTNYHLLTE